MELKWLEDLIALLEEQSVSRAALRKKRMLEPDLDCAAMARFSSTLKLGKTEVIWNVRPRPCRTRRGTDMSEMSTPASAIEPESDFRTPDI